MKGLHGAASRYKQTLGELMAIKLKNRRRESGIGVIVSWAGLGNKLPTESELIDFIKGLNQRDGLIVLIRLLRMADSGKTSAAERLNLDAGKYLKTALGEGIVAMLDQNPNAVFFSRWQLLFGVKLLCVFGNTKSSEDKPDDVIKLLLMINDFIYRDYGVPGKFESEIEKKESVLSSLIKQNLLFAREQLRYLIGRYYDLFRVRALNKSSDNWVDLEAVFLTKTGVSIKEFQALHLGIFSLTPSDQWDGKQAERPLSFCINPSTTFNSVNINASRTQSILNSITCTPEQVKEEHTAKYKESIGQVFDVTMLLQKPVLRLSEDCIAALSPQLVIERSTKVLYWDIHDALPDRGNENRTNFQAFFGRLFESYGQDVLKRIRDLDKRRRKLIGEGEYKSPNEKTTDGLLLERLGSKESCLMFEFTVGRPRLEDTILPGSILDFQKDLDKKIGTAVDQQVDLLKRLLKGEKTINDLKLRDIKRWFICVVVTDPFPSFEILTSSLSSKLDEFVKNGVDVKGVYILSLEELEFLETLARRSSVNQVLMDWKSSQDSKIPFSHFFYRKVNNIGREPENCFVVNRMDTAMNEMKELLFPNS